MPPTTRDLKLMWQNRVQGRRERKIAEPFPDSDYSTPICTEVTHTRLAALVPLLTDAPHSSKSSRLAVRRDRRRLAKCACVCRAAHLREGAHSHFRPEQRPISGAIADCQNRSNAIITELWTLNCTYCVPSLHGVQDMLATEVPFIQAMIKSSAASLWMLGRMTTLRRPRCRLSSWPDLYPDHVNRGPWSEM
ncbi:uncharacterized protein [Narcine bancroftii]|uniref:uncharacterized protein isoform X2 n=1 Tax=Narcine bancroftii TaxID=1343680 RepID=UPI003831DA51